MCFPVTYKEVVLRRLISLLSLLHPILVSLLHSCPGRPDDPAHSTSLSALLMIRAHLPVMRFIDFVASFEEVEDTCAVCMCEYEERDEVRWLTNCRHLFHRECVDRWIDLHHRTCPLCRTHLLAHHRFQEFNRRLADVDHYYYFPDSDDHE